MVGVPGNINDLVGMRLLAQQQQAMSRAMERLATGKRINRASDDPAGLIAADNFAAQSVGIRKEIDRLELRSLSLSAEEGALAGIGDLLIDLDSLIVMAGNRDILGEGELEAMQIEVNAIIDAIEFTLGSATFAGERIFKELTIQDLGTMFDLRSIGSSSAPDRQSFLVDAGDASSEPGGVGLAMRQVTVGSSGSIGSFTLADLRSGGALNLVDGDLEYAQDLATTLLKNNSTRRAEIGNMQKNFYERQINSLLSEFESLQSAESLIRDTDYAKEVSEYARAEVLQQAAMQSILIAQRVNAAGALSLLG